MNGRMKAVTPQRVVEIGVTMRPHSRPHHLYITQRLNAEQRDALQTNIYQQHPLRTCLVVLKAGRTKREVELVCVSTPVRGNE